jgi:branched-chain amino acid transport system ATP-binding protein
MAAFLEVQGLHAAYGLTRVLHGIDFAMDEGTITTLLGANGAGKTTTLRALCGMVKTQGQVRFAGERIDGRPTESIVRKGIAHVPDGRGTFVNLTTEENLRARRLHAQGPRGGRGRPGAHLRLLPAAQGASRPAGGHALGREQQMLAVSRALMLRPRLMLLDEPSFGLAPLIVQELFQILRTVNEKERVSMLVVEQNAAMALGLADHAYLIETGRIVLSGTSKEIQQNDAVRRSYLGY